MTKRKSRRQRYRPNVEEKECGSCGKVFESARKWGRYCSETCKKRAHYAEARHALELLREAAKRMK